MRAPIHVNFGPFAMLIAVPAAGALLCMGLALAAGVGPLDLLRTIWMGSWGSTEAAINTLAKMTPLLLAGLAVALAYRVGLLNIGCEGQLTIGALVSASFAVAAAPLPAFLLLPLTLAAGAVSGGLLALPAVLLRQRRGVHEVISTLLLNYYGYLPVRLPGFGAARGWDRDGKDSAHSGRGPNAGSFSQRLAISHPGAAHSACLFVLQPVPGFRKRSGDSRPGPPGPISMLR